MKMTVEGNVFEGKPEEIKEMLTLLGAEIPESAQPKVEEVATLKVGDYAKVVGASHNDDIPIGSIVKITETDETDIPYKAKLNDASEWDWFRADRLVRLSEKEVEEAVRAAKLAKLGRKTGEFKKGDIVRYVGRSTLNGVTLEVYEDTEDGRTKVDFRKHNYGICTEKNEELELIAPVESRVDIDE